MTQLYLFFVALNFLFVSGSRHIFFSFAAPKYLKKKSFICTFQRFAEQKFCIAFPHFSWTWSILIDSPTHMILLPPISPHWSYHSHCILQIAKFNIFNAFISLIMHQHLVQESLSYFPNAFSYAFFSSMSYFSIIIKFTQKYSNRPSVFIITSKCRENISDFNETGLGLSMVIQWLRTIPIDRGITNSKLSKLCGNV